MGAKRPKVLARGGYIATYGRLVLAFPLRNIDDSQIWCSLLDIYTTETDVIHI